MCNQVCKMNGELVKLKRQAGNAQTDRHDRLEVRTCCVFLTRINFELLIRKQKGEKNINFLRR